MSKLRVKAVLVGDPNVGKTALWRRMLGLPEVPLETTLGADFAARNITINGTEFLLELWDTAGEEKFRSLAAAYYKGADLIIGVFDLTRPETFTSLANDWLSEVTASVSGEETLLLVWGNKRDLVQQSFENTARSALEKRQLFELVGLGQKTQSQSSQFEYGYAEVSAKSGLGVQESLNAVLDAGQKLWKKKSRKVVDVMSTVATPAKKDCC